MLRVFFETSSGDNYIDNPDLFFDNTYADS